MTTEGNKEEVVICDVLLIRILVKITEKKSFLLFKEKEKKRERGKQDSFVQPHATRHTPPSTTTHHTPHTHDFSNHHHLSTSTKKHSKQTQLSQ